MVRKGVVAAGHNLVCDAAASILAEGGNAFDAMVGAGFSSAIAEPALTSLGGGGFMLTHDAKLNESCFFDFFVNTPGLGSNKDISSLHFFPIIVNFSGSQQDFNVGLGSVAVPGVLKGLLHVHRRLGRMGLSEIIQYAKEYGRGHILNSQQAHFLKLLRPIMTMDEAGRKLYQNGGDYLDVGDTYTNIDYVNFLEHVCNHGDREFYEGEIATAMVADMERRGGLLTMEDLKHYKVNEYTPFSCPYDQYTLITSPEPSVGGALIGLSLSKLEREVPGGLQWGSAEHLQQTAKVMKKVEELRDKGIITPAKVIEHLKQDQEYVQKEDEARKPHFYRGTTHVSIADKNGNCASMTCSNGEGAGYFAPSTGVMLNNMMGEDDLHPDGFHSSPAGIRVTSMMSPSMLLKGDSVKLVIGSGGSKRIRTAIGQVLSKVVKYDMGLQKAVDGPRLYWDGKSMQVEPGFSKKAISALSEVADVNEWPGKDVYFGGVHAVIPGETGAGDKRRGGAVIIVE